MFESERFTQLLQEKISETVDKSELVYGFDPNIVQFLQLLALQNEDILMARESTKPVGERRGMKEALKSARRLVKAAARIADKRGGATIRMSDIEAAHDIKFCKVWPFCRS